MPKKQAKALAKPLQMYYKGRLYKLYLVNAQWAVKVVWKLAKKMVDPLTLLKFKLLGDKFQPELLNDIDQHNLEQKYGGTIPDKADKFFPPELI